MGEEENHVAIEKAINPKRESLEKLFVVAVKLLVRCPFILGNKNIKIDIFVHQSVQIYIY